MDKRSFNVLFTIVAASMVVLGTYKIAKKRTTTVHNPVQAVAKSK